MPASERYLAPVPVTNNPTLGTISAAAAAAGIANVLIWLLSLYSIEIPSHVATDIGMGIAIAIAFVIHRLPPPPASRVDVLRAPIP